MSTVPTLELTRRSVGRVQETDPLPRDVKQNPRTHAHHNLARKPCRYAVQSANEIRAQGPAVPPRNPTAPADYLSISSLGSAASWPTSTPR